mmetsp:Transcript_28764/g.92101  ORF Transcript_28764/g.92101 Transcript_28764/m.92101 type:complete len:227 (-) Transcript_28764:1250-1930(-)
MVLTAHPRSPGGWVCQDGFSDTETAIRLAASRVRQRVKCQRDTPREKRSPSKAVSAAPAAVRSYPNRANGRDSRLSAPAFPPQVPGTSDGAMASDPRSMRLHTASSSSPRDRSDSMVRMSSSAPQQPRARLEPSAPLRRCSHFHSSHHGALARSAPISATSRRSSAAAAARISSSSSSCALSAALRAGAPLRVTASHPKRVTHARSTVRRSGSDGALLRKPCVRSL